MTKIELATINDLTPLSILFDAYRVFYRKRSDIEGAASYLNERILCKQAINYIATIEGELVGCTLLYSLFSSTNMRQMWLLNDLFVTPKHRGKKISKGLIKAAQKYCELTKAQGISLETEKNNIEGNGLYPKMGFDLDKEHNFYFWENPTFSSL